MMGLAFSGFSRWKVTSSPSPLVRSWQVTMGMCCVVCLRSVALAPASPLGIGPVMLAIIELRCRCAVNRPAACWIMLVVSPYDACVVVVEGMVCSLRGSDGAVQEGLDLVRGHVFHGRDQFWTSCFAGQLLQR